MANNETKIDKERCVLVGVKHTGKDQWQTKDHLFELAQLVYTAGAEPVDQIIQDRSRLDTTYFIGKGKANELAQTMKEKQCQMAIFDDDLSPAQVNNLETITEAKIIDRSGLILDIFAQHAQSRESHTQVELAQLNYLLPRLTRQWTHLSRQVGGIGTKGPGETQLETDRRLIRTRISHLNADLNKIEKQRKTQRKKRSDVFLAALVGYTNVGKSTLMHTLTGADVLIENQLFATLDATTRKFQLDSGIEILLSDTVGFIRKLPHHLVASFRSTLAEVRDADLIIHIVDVSSPSFTEHMATVEEVLKDLGANEKPVLIVFNKIDLIDNPALMRDISDKYDNSVIISASRGIQIGNFVDELTKFVERHFAVNILRIDQKYYDLVNYLHEEGHVLATEYEDNKVIFKVKMDHRKMERLLKDDRVERIKYTFKSSGEK